MKVSPGSPDGTQVAFVDYAGEGQWCWPGPTAAMPTLPSATTTGSGSPNGWAGSPVSTRQGQRP